MNSLVTKENNNIFTKIVNFFKSIFKKSNTKVEAVEDDFLPEVYAEESPEVSTEKTTTEETNSEEVNSDYKIEVDSVKLAKEARRKQVIEQIKRDPNILKKMTMDEIDKIYSYLIKNNQN